MDTRIDGKIALVTGAGSGIGRQIAAALHAERAVVVAADVDLESAEETCSMLGPKSIAVEMDVSSGESVGQSLQQCVERAGGLDIVVNNAGISIPGTVESLPEEQWDHGMATNLKSIYLVSKVSWPLLAARGGGSIVNIASISGIWAGPNDAAYCASKAAVIMLTKCVALDGASVGIRVNAVCPGWIGTPMIERIFDRMPDAVHARQAARRLHPLGDFGTPQDIAGAVVYLSSDAARWVTGSIIVVDGGLTCGLSPHWAENPSAAS